MFYKNTYVCIFVFNLLIIRKEKDDTPANKLRTRIFSRGELDTLARPCATRESVDTAALQDGGGFQKQIETTSVQQPAHTPAIGIQWKQFEALFTGWE